MQGPGCAVLGAPAGVLLSGWLKNFRTYIPASFGEWKRLQLYALRCVGRQDVVMSHFPVLHQSRWRCEFRRQLSSLVFVASQFEPKAGPQSNMSCELGSSIFHSRTRMFCPPRHSRPNAQTTCNGTVRQIQPSYQFNLRVCLACRDGLVGMCHDPLTA